ncbi:RpiB/LacA/LacB family sugar-phosphate isomerase [Candidatus Latescibacterota bacterium]
MNQQELIEAVVREVKRVLSQRGISLAPPSSGRAVQPPVLSPGSVPSPSPGITKTFGTHDLTGKQVITQRDLESFGGTSIQVSKKTVITPLAVDYAREKGITITRIEDTQQVVSGAGQTPSAVVVALVISPDFSGDRSIVNKILTSKGFQIKDHSGQNYESALYNLADSVSSSEANFGVCIEKTGMEGPIHANRNSTIRAVHCRNTYEARAARVDFGANVMVIDSASDPDAVISGFCGM